jgi:hypothetical protein
MIILVSDMRWHVFRASFNVIKFVSDVQLDVISKSEDMGQVEKCESEVCEFVGP